MTAQTTCYKHFRQVDDAKSNEQESPTKKVT